MTDETQETSRSAEEAQAALLQTFDPKIRQFVQNANAFGDSIRSLVYRLRNENDWTQGHLGDQVGVSASTISRLEKGRGLSGLDLDLAVSVFAAMGAALQLNIVPLKDGCAWDVSDQRGATLLADSTGRGHSAIEGRAVRAGAGPVYVSDSGEQTDTPASDLETIGGLVTQMSRMTGVQQEQFKQISDLTRQVQSLCHQITRTSK